MLSENRNRLLGASVYYTLQGLSILGCWRMVVSVPDLRTFFLSSRMTDTAFMDIFWISLILMGLGSWTCAFLLWKRPNHGFIQPLTWFLVGGSIYPMVYACWSTYITDGEGWATSLCLLLLGAGLFVHGPGLDNPLFRVAPDRTRMGHIFRTFLHTSIFWFISLALVPWC